MSKLLFLLFPILFLATSCHGCPPAPSSSDAAPPAPPASAEGGGAGSATATIVNDTPSPIMVFIAFGANSAVLPSPSWCPGSGLNCSFSLAGGASLPVPVQGAHLNGSISFGAAVGCGTTKAELDLNNPAWYDTADVSMVDGYNGKVEIDVTDASKLTSLGPPLGKTGNEKVVGLFPLGCDICVARQNPPCGISKGADGCKGGTQYKPDVICQYQGSVMGGGISASIHWKGP